MCIRDSDRSILPRVGLLQVIGTDLRLRRLFLTLGDFFEEATLLRFDEAVGLLTAIPTALDFSYLRFVREGRWLVCPGPLANLLLLLLLAFLFDEGLARARTSHFEGGHLVLVHRRHIVGIHHDAGCQSHPRTHVPVGANDLLLRLLRVERAWAHSTPLLSLGYDLGKPSLSWRLVQAV